MVREYAKIASGGSRLEGFKSSRGRSSPRDSQEQILCLTPNPQIPSVQHAQILNLIRLDELHLLILLCTESPS